MSDHDHEAVQRLQTIMTSLLKGRLEESLTDVESALAKWRDGGLGVFEAHAELLRHAARAERLAERMARLGLDNAGSLLRDAFEAKLLSREEFVELTGRQPEEIPASPPGETISEELDGVSEPVSGRLPNKRDLVEDLLGAGPVLLHIDARHEDISVPEHFRSDPKLVLRFGYGLTPAIIDLSLDDECITGTLTFSGVPHRCVLRWTAIYAVVSEVDHKGMVWPDDVPAAVVDELTGGSDGGPEPATPPSAPSNPRASHLKLVK